MLMQAGTDGKGSRKVHCGVKYGCGVMGRVVVMVQTPGSYLACVMQGKEPWGSGLCG